MCVCLCDFCLSDLSLPIRAVGGRDFLIFVCLCVYVEWNFGQRKQRQKYCELSPLAPRPIHANLLVSLYKFYIIVCVCVCGAIVYFLFNIGLNVCVCVWGWWGYSNICITYKTPVSVSLATTNNDNHLFG